MRAQVVFQDTPTAHSSGHPIFLKTLKIRIVMTHTSYLSGLVLVSLEYDQAARAT